MPFKLTIVVPDTALVSTLKAIPPKYIKSQVPIDDDVESAPPEKSKTVSAKHVLTMTGKNGLSPSSKIGKAIAEFEKLEVKNGVGSVTRGELRAQLKKKKMTNASQMITVLLGRGYFTTNGVIKA